MKIPRPDFQKAAIFYKGQAVGKVTDMQIIEAAKHVRQTVIAGVKHTSIEMDFVLTYPEDPLPGLRQLCADVVNRHFGDRMRDYVLHVDETTEAHVAHERSSFVVRITPRGARRSIGNMSFNYYHRDFDKIEKVRNRLRKRLDAYCKRILGRFRTPEQLAASAARRAKAEANRPDRIARDVARADAAFAELEKTT